MCQLALQSPKSPKLPASGGGFNRFELLVCLVLLGIFSSVMLERLLYYRAQAEQAAVQQVVTQLRAGLQLRMALLLARNQQQQLEILAQQNPMLLLAEQPANYLGEFYRIPEHDIAPGNWYFERNSGQLVYLFSRTTGKSGGNRVYLKLNLLRAPGLAGETGKITAVVLDLHNH